MYLSMILYLSIYPPETTTAVQERLGLQGADVGVAAVPLLQAALVIHRGSASKKQHYFLFGKIN